MNALRKTVTISQVVDFLNELLRIDHDSINALFSIRISCNEALRDHPSVQVGLLGKNHPIVGMIGILNGLFGVDKNKWGHISADYEGHRIVKFRRLTEKDTTKLESGRR